MPISGNAQIAKLATTFFTEALSAEAKTKTEVDAAIRSQAWSMYNGTVFRRTNATLVAHRALLISVLKALGPNSSNDKQISAIAWDTATDGSPLADKAKTFAKAIDNEHAGAYERIEPCFAVLLDGIQKLEIGDVVVELAASVATELNTRDVRWRLEAGKAPGNRFDESTFVIGMPACVWRVKVTAFKGNVPGQAAWLIDVALSLLRLSIPNNRRKGNFPYLGAIETMPSAKPSKDDTGISLYKTGASFGGLGLMGWYEISKSTFSKKELATLHGHATSLMSAQKNSVGERFARGLGWLSRGRRASDQVDRFLYFFTAIEALLTTDDKRAPITETICRSAACILAAIPHRAQIAKEFSDLYDLRSKVVHGGHRLVSDIDSKDLQLRAEALFYVVLKKVAMNQSASDFHAQLKSASYGDRWP